MAPVGEVADKIDYPREKLRRQFLAGIRFLCRSIDNRQHSLDDTVLLL
jgi:hypothetical protein